MITKVARNCQTLRVVEDDIVSDLNITDISTTSILLKILHGEIKDTSSLRMYVHKNCLDLNSDLTWTKEGDNPVPDYTDIQEWKDDMDDDDLNGYYVNTPIRVTTPSTYSNQPYRIVPQNSGINHAKNQAAFKKVFGNNFKNDNDKNFGKLFK